MREVRVPIIKELPTVHCDLNQTLDTDVLYEAGRCIQNFKQRDMIFRGEEG